MSKGLTPQQARNREYLAQSYFGGQAYFRTMQIGRVRTRVVAGIKYWQPAVAFKGGRKCH